ncbi:MAG: hypothetical protein Q7Q71_09850 [Verrucomicrobiota bacterium JB023]|nr:hypothetical protein [Verrucomicrobiota bacterium JB023]
MNWPYPLPCLLSLSLFAAASENTPPTISFPPSSFDLREAFVLRITPSCNDDGLPTDGNKRAGWELVSGPANGVTIEVRNQNNYKTEFTFSEVGQYTLRFIAFDGEHESSRDCFVDVTASGITNVRGFEVVSSSYKNARTTWTTIRDNYYTTSGPHAAHLGFAEEDFHLDRESEVIVTLLYDGASYRNSLAWFDANDPGPEQGTVIWHDVATGPDQPLDQGSRTSLGLLPAGTDLRFYLIQDGAGVGEQVISQVAGQNPQSREQVAARFPQTAPGSLVVAFEDKLDGNSYDDVVFQVELIPTGDEAAQFDHPVEQLVGLFSDRGSRGVAHLLDGESISASEEIIGGVFQMPHENTTYTFRFLDDRSPMKFTLGFCALDSLTELGAPNLLFREQAILHAVTIMDDRDSNPGQSVTFRPQNHDLLGKRVVLFLIPNNTPAKFLSNPWRYTAMGNGENTKRQPLFSIPEANPGGLDQFFFFERDEETFFTIEDKARAATDGELGEASDSSFDDIQIRVTPALIPTERHQAFFGKTIDYSIGYEANDGLASSIAYYDERRIMKAANGSRRWDLLFSTLTQPDGAYLVSEFGESLPISSTGAVSVNIDYEAGSRSDFFIEQQRYGADVIETGIILNDEPLIAEGIKMINWGFQQQGSDGSFPGTGDAVHSSSLFLEAAARAGLALKNYKSRTYRQTITDWRRKTHLLAQWFIGADEQGRDVNLEPFGHRYFLRGAALAEAARFTRDRSLEADADAYITAAITLQEEDGSTLERGTFDASYHMVGMAFGSRYFATSRNQQLRDDLSLSLWKGISRFLQDVSGDGEVTIAADSRTATEKSRSGANKRFDFKHTTKALVFAEEGLHMPNAEDAAELILSFYGVMDE